MISSISFLQSVHLILPAQCFGVGNINLHNLTVCLLTSKDGKVAGCCQQEMASCS